LKRAESWIETGVDDSTGVDTGSVPVI